MSLNRNYEILEISSDATFEEAKAAYRLLVQVWHPDKHSHNEKLQAKATNKIKEINTAWREVEAYFKNGGAGTPEAERTTNEKHESSQQAEQAPTYTDQESDLMWATNGNIAGKQMNWFDATSWVKNLNYGEYTDWRLPQLCDFDSFPISIAVLNTHGFYNFQPNLYWTCDSVKDDDNFATFINMNSGGPASTVKTHECYVLPVRGGHFKDDATREAEIREAERFARDYMRETEQNLPPIKVSFSSVNNRRVRCPVCNSNQVLSRDNIIYSIFKCTECKSEVGIVADPNETIKQPSAPFHPLAQQSVAANIIRGLIVITIFGFILRGCG